MFDNFFFIIEKPHKISEVDISTSEISKIGKYKLIVESWKHNFLSILIFLLTNEMERKNQIENWIESDDHQTKKTDGEG